MSIINQLSLIENIAKLCKDLSSNGFDLSKVSLNDITAKNSEAKILPKIQDELLNSDWPQAVNPTMVCNPDNEQDKAVRAEGIIDLFLGERVKGKRVLDFGCGQGHSSIEAHKQGATISIGYDLNNSGSFDWEINKDGLLLTTDFQKVKDNGPYDLVLLYDVLDHAEYPVDVLNQIREVCNPIAEISVRCHPWISRHGGHAYYFINKAWVQLFNTDEELRKVGVTDISPQHIPYPLDIYMWWFQSAGFEIVKQDIENQPVEFDIIQRSSMQQILSKIYPEIDNLKFAFYQMQKSFIDFKLKIGAPMTADMPNVFCVAIWNHYVGGKFVDKNYFFSNGTFAIGKEKGKWKLNADEIDMSWINPKGENFINKAKLSHSHKVYIGKNNKNQDVQGILI